LLSINSISAATENQTANITNIGENQENITNLTNSNTTNSSNTTNIQNSTNTVNSNTTNSNNTTNIQNTAQAAGGSSYSKMKGIWLKAEDVNNLNVTALKNLGITDVFVKCNLISTPTYSSVLTAILQKLQGTDIRVHAWITCFIDANGKWIDPTNETQREFLINSITNIVKNYNIDGINLDYVRYPGTAHNYDNATGTITSFVQLVYDTVKSINPEIAVSADLMPEGSVNAYYYGQNYTQLAEYLDFMVPMIYKGNYGYSSSTGTNSNGKNGTDWIGSTVAYIVSQANGTPVIACLQTYRSDSNVTAIPANELQSDVNAAINNGSSGYALFRYGLINSAFGVDSTSPTVKSIDPINNAVNIPINKVIKVTFSESIKAGTGTIYLKNLKTGKYVTITKKISGNVLTITPTSVLTKATQYSIILNAGSITDLSGNTLKAYTTKFTTDSTAPTVKTIDPTNKATNIPINKVIKVTFSESIKAGTGTIYLKNLKTGKYVTITKKISGNTLTMTPKSSLTKATQYSIILNAGSITDLSGNTLKAYTTKFTTDSTIPTVKTIDPTNKATNVPINKVIKVTFSEPIKAGTLGVGIKNVKTGKYVSITKSISGNVLTMTLKSNLAKATQYSIVLSKGSITDLAGNSLNAYTTKFTTDSTIPTVKSIDPANKATNVAVNKVIKITFSEPIKAGTLGISIKNVKTGKYVSITKNISGNTLALTPTSNLANATQYSIVLSKGSITDLAGNSLNTYTTTFTTSGVTTGATFTISQVNTAAASVKSYIESNNKLPNYVTIGSSQVTMPQFLQLLATSLLQINNGTSTSMIPGSIKAPTSPTGSYIYGNVYEAEYLSIAQSIKSYINSNGIAPNYVSSSLGNIQYESLIYTYSKILNYYKTNGALPTYVLVDTTASSLQQYLQATTNCQVTNSQIQALAKSITSGKTSTYDKSVAIFNWVRDNIGYSFYYNTKYGAVGTLNAKTGNCVDTAHLLIALERAAGIPARYEHVNAQFSSGTWYGHVIAQVYVNGKWYNADATSYSNTFGVIKNWNTATATYYGTYATLPF
jgi:transglutaminase-like putative cysteine protease/methionine-rich copper-binding protein CopC